MLSILAILHFLLAEIHDESANVHENTYINLFNKKIIKV